MSTRLEWLRNEGEIRSFSAGQVVFAKGDQGDVMYGVVEGEVEITVNGQVIETIQPGGFFGEMALLDASPRSAAATARTDCRLAAISQRRYIFLIQSMPFFALEVMKVMAERLRRLMTLPTQ